MANTEIINLLETVLGYSTAKSRGNYAFHCPFCNHKKKKLEVHPEKQSWNCWVCGTKGKSLYSLLRRINAAKAYIDRLFQILPKKSRIFNKSNSNPDKLISLPKEYIPLWHRDEKNFYWRRCIKYLSSRNISVHDILKYRLGYCTEGKYSNMIIIPNYNKCGQLTYFTTRSFSNNNSTKFINPPYSRNVVGFELQINWDLPVILVEGALDAIAVRRNSSPLYGTTLSKKMKLHLIENKVKDLYIALDEDAIIKSIDVAEYLMNNGMNVYFVQLSNGQDPNQLGFERMWKLINNTSKLTNQELFKFKIQNLL